MERYRNPRSNRASQSLRTGPSPFHPGRWRSTCLALPSRISCTGIGSIPRRASSFGSAGSRPAWWIYLVAAASSGCEAEASEHAYRPLIYGFVVPPMATMLLDDLLLARERVAQPPRATVSPRVLVQPGLALFGVAGSF
jgi:hypothetical protein